MAVEVSTRLWLAGAVSTKRDYALLFEIMAYIRSVALCRPLHLAVDGLPSYLKVFQKAFRTPLLTGRLGRP